MKPTTLKKIEKALHVDHSLNIAELSKACNVGRSTLVRNPKHIECIKKLKWYKSSVTYSRVPSICNRESVSFYNSLLLMKLGFGTQVTELGGCTVVGKQGLIFYTKDDHLIEVGKKGIKLETRENIPTIEKIALSMGLVVSTDGAIDMRRNKITARMILSSLVALSLKDLKIVNGRFTQKKQLKYGEMVFGLYYQAVTGSGRVSSKSQYRRWLAEEDTLNIEKDLFKKGSYLAGDHSMEYKPTHLMEKVILNAWMQFRHISFVSHDIALKALDIAVDIDYLSSVKLRDSMIILADCIGYDSNFIIRPVITDEKESRVESYMTQISKDSRLKLDLIEYDISTAQQTIMMSFVKDISKYPLHQRLISDKVSFREEVMKLKHCDYERAKEIITTLSNLETWGKGRKKIPLLFEFWKEACMLRTEFLNNIPDQMMRTARKYTKYVRRPVFDSDGKVIRYEDTTKKKKSGIVFFAWTQVEREIRLLMMSCFKNPVHQVHDAVWSKEIIDKRLIEQRILEETGMTIGIG